MKSLRLILILLAFAIPTSVFAQDFFSKEQPSRLFNIGLRAGINISNRTFPKSAFNRWNVNSWGMGVTAGCVVDLNIRDYLSIQPGIFFESRSGNYSYADTYRDNATETKDLTQLGHNRYFDVAIPVLLSFKFNLSSNLRLSAEAGPYIQYFLHDSSSDKIQVITSPSAPIVTQKAQSNKLDAGLKIGTGLTFHRHYSVFVHYMAGGKKVWKSPVAGGHNKAWLFTVGYDL